MFRWKNKKLEKGQITGQMFSNNSVAYAVLFAAVLAMTFFGVCTPQQGGLNLGGVAARVGGEKISFQEFNLTYQNTYDRFQRIYQDAFDPATIPSMVMDQLVERYVIYNQARNAGVGVADSEVDEQIIETFKGEDGKFDAESFRNNVKAMGFTEDQYFELFRRDMVVQKYRQFVGDVAYLSTPAAKMEFQVRETTFNLEYLKLTPESVKVSVTSADIQTFLEEEANKKRIEDYYNANLAEFNKEKRVKASHIVIAYTGSRRASSDLQRSKEEAKELAEKVLAEARAPGANFAALANKYTDELTGKSKGGDLGYFAAEDMAPAFSKAAFAAKQGEIPDVVETDFGFHVLKVTGIEPAKKRTVEQASEAIAKILIENDRKPEILARRAERILEELQSGNASKTINDYGYTWELTGEFRANSRSIPGLGSDPEFQKAAFTQRKPGDVYEKVISDGADRYIVRLKERDDADLAAFDDAKRVEIVRDRSFQAANTVFTALKDAYSDKLDTNGRIWRNKDYLTIAQRSDGG